MTAIKRKLVIKILYLSMLNLDRLLIRPNILSKNNIINIIASPLEAPFTSALLKDICDDIHIAKNINK